MVTEKPNLFHYATSELSQDAFLCWLLRWANHGCAREDPALHATAVDFVLSILNKCGHSCELDSGKPIPLKVNPIKQYKFVDVLAEVDYGENQFAIVIEDKTNTTMHGKQLKTHRDIVEADYPSRACLLVYLKTGAISQAKQAKEAGYVVYSRKNLLKVLNRRKGEISNHIYMDFLDHLCEKHRRYNKFRTNKVIKWVRCWEAWQGFFEYLQERLPSCGWGYEANQSGGELVFYSNGESIIDGHVYTEIHKKWDKRHPDGGRYFLAFKVCNVPQDKDRRTVRWKLYEALMFAAIDHGWKGKVEKPQRFGYGESMVFCETKDQGCWLVNDAEGKLNIEGTIQKLKLADKILLDAVDNYLSE